MDLSFPRFEADATVTFLPPDLAVLMVGIAARQAASPTAMLHARLTPPRAETNWFAPVHGAFNQTVAHMLKCTADPLPHPTSHSEYAVGGPVGERTGAVVSAKMLTPEQEE